MSLFDFPRIHVWGTQCVNPGTGNNDSASPGTELTVTSDTERVRAMTQGMTDDQFRTWITELDPYGLLRCQWNYYGDMSLRFLDVRVRSVQLAAGAPVTDPAREPLIGSSVYLSNALICDNDPEGFNGTQVFSESLELRAPGAFGGSGTFLSRKPSRATTRWLNWYRNVSYHGSFGLPPDGANGKLSSGGAGGASATFQCAIEVKPDDLLEVASQSPALELIRHKLLAKPDSPAATALVSALRDPRARGLVFRYNLYLCYPEISDTELTKIFASGEKKQNPSYGLVIGTLAPWYEGEAATITMGRFLKPAASYQNPYRKPPSSTYYLSPAVAQVDAAALRVSVDLANCLPEDGPDGDKYNLGAVTLGVRAATLPGADPSTNTAPVTPIGALVDDKPTFLDQGGIYDLSYAALTPAEQALLQDDGQELVLQTGLHGVLLYEPEYMLMSDCSCNYLDELPNGASWDDPAVRAELAAAPCDALRGEIELLLRKRGRAPSGPVRVRVEQWRETPTGYVDQFGAYRYPTLLGSEQITVEGGRGSYRLRPVEGAGLRVFRFVPETNWPQDIDPATLASLAFQEFCVELRVLPYDDYSKLDDAALTWDLIYDQIFRYYALILPAMSLRLDMSDPTIWQSPTAARYVLRTTQQALWASWEFMPRTRDLSKYRRELLQRFCRKLLRQHGIHE